MWFTKENRSWEKIPEDEMIRRLSLPKGKLDMVLDTDTYNEVDDQFALAYSLLSPERLNVEAIYAAPFYNDRSTGPKDGMERSYNEIVRLLGKIRRVPEGLVHRGADQFMPGPDTPVDSPAVQDLIHRAMAREEGDLLYVCAIAACTNIASALLLEPRIAHKIAVVWLGGHVLADPTAEEFNLSQDLHASRVLFDSGVPLTLVPCRGVASHLLTSVPELQSCIGEKNALCDALIELFSAYHPDHFAWGKEIWDVSTVAWLLNPEWVTTRLVHSPLLTDDSHWAHDETRHFIREAYACYRNPIFYDLFTKLANA